MRKLKKALSLALALAMCLGLMAVPAAALEPGEEWAGDFVVNGDHLVRYYGEDSVVAIPANITSIGYEAFKDCTSVTSVAIPSGVTEIGDYAFKGCTGLKSMTIPGSVFDINVGTFQGCTSLESVTLSQGVGCLSSASFQGCTSLKSITIPSSMVQLWNDVFRDCTSLESVTIQPGITSFGDSVFRDCTSLKSITIPEGVTSIGSYMFDGCTSLTSASIPSGVKTIGSHMFNKCTSLTSVTIPNSITIISGSAFYGCTSLKSINIPASVERMEGAFTNVNVGYKTGLTDIYFAGSKAQWKANGGEAEVAKANVTVHFNSTGPAVHPQPDPKPQPETPKAKAGNQNIEIDGKAVAFQTYMLADANGNGTNYVKLRDIAHVLNGTGAQFSVGYNKKAQSISATTGTAYKDTGTEMDTPFAGADKEYVQSQLTIVVNGTPVQLDTVTLMDDSGNGYNYFKLRDLGDALGFKVGYSRARGVYVETK